MRAKIHKFFQHESGKPPDKAYVKTDRYKRKVSSYCPVMFI